MANGHHEENRRLSIHGDHIKRTDKKTFLPLQEPGLTQTVAPSVEQLPVCLPVGMAPEGEVAVAGGVFVAVVLVVVVGGVTEPPLLLKKRRVASKLSVSTKSTGRDGVSARHTSRFFLVRTYLTG